MFAKDIYHNKNCLISTNCFVKSLNILYLERLLYTGVLSVSDFRTYTGTDRLTRPGRVTNAQAEDWLRGLTGLAFEL
jgi:hypothetical protein